MHGAMLRRRLRRREVAVAEFAAGQYGQCVKRIMVERRALCCANPVAVRVDLLRGEADQPIGLSELLCQQRVLGETLAGVEVPLQGKDGTFPGIAVGELSDDQQSRLAAALSTASGKNVTVQVIVDADVMGGLVTQIGDTVYDGSVRTRLEKMKERLS